MTINWQGQQGIKPSQIIGELPASAPSGGGDGIEELFSGLQGLMGGIAKASGFNGSQANATGTVTQQPSMQTYGSNAYQAQQAGPLQIVTDKTAGLYKHGGPTDPTSIIFHDTAGPSLKSAQETLQQRGLSYNYLIDKDGSIHTLVPAGIKAYHAKGYNNGTIGVSFVGGGGFGNVNPAQQQAAVTLSQQLKQQFPGLTSFAGHRDKSHAGKIDPEGFDYSSFSKATGLTFSAGPGSSRYKYDFSPGKETSVVPHNILGTKPMMPYSGITNQQQATQSMNKQTIDTIKKFEGLEDFKGGMSHARWDVNAFRAGYGSDTYTTADGKVHKVTSDTRVTKEDAERDLQRRAQEFETTAKNQSGNVWNSFDASTQAALTSIAYNYGSLPKRILPAIRSGDRTQIAEAVRGLGSDNKGVNRSRRNQEADMILNGDVQDSNTSYKASIEVPTDSNPMIDVFRNLTPTGRGSSQPSLPVSSIGGIRGDNQKQGPYFNGQTWVFPGSLNSMPNANPSEQSAPMPNAEDQTPNYIQPDNRIHFAQTPQINWDLLQQILQQKRQG